MIDEVPVNQIDIPWFLPFLVMN